MIKNLDDYDAMFEATALQFPHELILDVKPQERIAKTVHSVDEHRAGYFAAINALRDQLGMFRPTILVHSSKCRSTTVIEVIPPKEILEQMGSIQ